MAVKVILRESVTSLGRRGDIVGVKPGYARNYLLPRGLALAATPGNLKVVEQQRRTWAAREAHEERQAHDLATRISALELEVRKKAGESGTLYGSVTKTEIHELLAARGFDIDRRLLGPDEPIKTLGTHELTAKLHHGVTARFKLHVVAQAAAD